MPILDLGVRFSDSYRVRLGDMSGRTKDGKPKPVAFEDRIRITAPGPEVPQAFADVYGTVGDTGVTEWEDDKSPDCFETYLPIRALPIWIMPGQVLTQWWELYRGKVCERRCEGTGGMETLGNTPCRCSPDIDARIADKGQCAIMTRLSIMCPGVQSVLGAGSLVTHSVIAASAFQGAMYLAAPWLAKNVPVDAILRTHTHKGRTTFTFPVLEIGGPVDRTPELGAGPRVAQLDAGSPPPPAIGAGVERPGTAHTVAASPAAPPPFDSSNELIVDPGDADALKEEARAGGLTGQALLDAVKGATGGTNVLRKVRKADWPKVETAVYAAMEAIVEQRAAGVAS